MQPQSSNARVAWRPHPSAVLSLFPKERDFCVCCYQGKGVHLVASAPCCPPILASAQACGPHLVAPASANTDGHLPVFISPLVRNKEPSTGDVTPRILPSASLVLAAFLSPNTLLVSLGFLLSQLSLLLCFIIYITEDIYGSEGT